MTSAARGYAQAIVGSMCYGLNPFFALPLYSCGLDPTSVLFYRYVFAVVLVGLFAIFRRESLSATRKELFLVALMGVLFATSSLTLFYSFKFMDAGIASTILFTYPLFVALIAAIVFREKTSSRTWFSLLLATMGIVLLYKNGNGETLNVCGVSLVLLSALTYAIYMIGVSRSVLQAMPTLKLTFYSMLSGTLIFVFALRGGIDLVPLNTPFVWACAFGLAFFPTFVSMAFINGSIHRIGPVSAAIIGALEPLTALAVSILVFNGRLTFVNCIGIVFILFAVLVVVLHNNRK